jgi:hypothetical protein
MPELARSAQGCAAREKNVIAGANSLASEAERKMGVNNNHYKDA